MDEIKIMFIYMM